MACVAAGRRGMERGREVLVAPLWLPRGKVKWLFKPPALVDVDFWATGKVEGKDAEEGIEMELLREWERVWACLRVLLRGKSDGAGLPILKF